jgi:D-glycero-D-manno-heptose 1,7-bisphosphate phosphatase
VSAAEDLTVRRVQLARNRIERCFMLLYCDNYWPMRIDHMWCHYQAVGKPAMITVYRNSDGYSKDSVKVKPCGNVEVFDRSRTTPGLKGVEISYAILTREVLDLLPDEDALFEEAVYPKLVGSGKLSAYVTEHRYYSVGSMGRLPLTDEFLARRPVALLDRDGVLNRKPPRAHYVRTSGEFEWLPGAKTALAQLKSAGYRLIVISNQAGVARGAMTEADLAAVNSRMMDEAAEAGGGIDAIYTCTHGWDEGCECRKPKPGMLIRAAKELGCDLSRSWMIGDNRTDLEAGWNAGARSALVRTGDGEGNLAYEAKRWAKPANLIATNLHQAVCDILWG